MGAGGGGSGMRDRSETPDDASGAASEGEAQGPRVPVTGAGEAQPDPQAPELLVPGDAASDSSREAGGPAPDEAGRAALLGAVAGDSALMAPDNGPGAQGTGAGEAHRSLPPAGPPRSRRGGGGLLVNLLAGATVAALGVAAGWLMPRPVGDAALASRVATLEGRVDSIEAAPVAPLAPDDSAAALTALEARLTALEEDAGRQDLADRVAALENRPLASAEGDAGSEALDDLAARVAALEARPAVPEPAAPPSDRPAAAEASAGAVSSQDEPPDVQSGTAPSAAQAGTPALAALSARLAAAEAALAALSPRVDRVEAEATDAAAAARAATEAAQGASARLQSAEAEAARAQAEADAAAAEATRAAVEARLREPEAGLARAIEAGEPLGSALAALAEAGVAAPPALAAYAEAPPPTLAALRDRFPEAAREALAASRAAGLAADGTGLAGFINSQLSLRSTAPREGSDPDAILSRAEAALREGDLDGALVELVALPAPARGALAPWEAEATGLRDALAALAALPATPAP